MIRGFHQARQQGHVLIDFFFIKICMHALRAVERTWFLVDGNYLSESDHAGEKVVIPHGGRSGCHRFCPLLNTTYRVQRAIGALRMTGLRKDRTAKR